MVPFPTALSDHYPRFQGHAVTMYRLYHTLEWYARVYPTPGYGITYLFHDRRATANTGRSLAR